MKSIRYDHAAQRKTYVGVVYDIGSQAVKQAALDNMKEEYARFHKEGRIHIHDLEAYGQTYNCLTPNILTKFPYAEFRQYSDLRKILEIFNYYRYIIVNLGIEQSGGIGFCNFDAEIETLFQNLNIQKSESIWNAFRDNVDSFMKWVNDARDRCGQVQYYVSLNIGLATGEVGRFVTASVISCFKASDNIRPNIIFKLKNGINHQKGDKNYDLFCQAMECTCKKMIPTYLLCDSELNQSADPTKISIMGCRTKVVQNENGDAVSLGRGNIVYTTINLPRIALEIDRDHHDWSVEEKLGLFKQKWQEIAGIVKEQLLDRYHAIAKMDPDDFPCNTKHNLWINEFGSVKSLEEIFKQGTLSIGYIGLSEVLELLTGQKYFASEENHQRAIELVKFMRGVIDGYRRDYKMNFTLLATSGEFISGRFPDIDKKTFNHPLVAKEFYTNSFHVDVDSGMSPFEKLRFEGPFHKLSNGGCISYVEFKSAPLNNVEAIHELVEHAIRNNINYLGFNFPLDRCLDCGTTGTFDTCEKCGSARIQRIRRVSGYLEDLAFFTPGKKAEVAHRKPNS